MQENKSGCFSEHSACIYVIYTASDLGQQGPDHNNSEQGCAFWFLLNDVRLHLGSQTAPET